MNDPDLSLVSIEILRNAIYDRCQECVIVTKRSEDSGPSVVQCCSKEGSVSGVGLSAVAYEFFLRDTINP